MSDEFRLTTSERDVLQILANDCSQLEAARLLGISNESVRGRLKNAKARNDVETTTGLLAEAMRVGLVG